MKERRVRPFSAARVSRTGRVQGPCVRVFGQARGVSLASTGHVLSAVRGVFFSGTEHVLLLSEVGNSDYLCCFQ